MAVHHKHLEAQVGEWDTVARMEMDPTQPVNEEKGTCSKKMVLGGRFLQVIHTATFMAMPFEGMELVGHNNLAGCYESTWVDTMGTGQYRTSGHCEKDGAVLTLTGEWEGIEGTQNVRLVTTIEGPDRHVLRMYDTKDGNERMTFEMVFTRRK